MGRSSQNKRGGEEKIYINARKKNTAIRADARMEGYKGNGGGNNSNGESISSMG